MEDERLAPVDDAVTGVRAALITRDDLGGLGQRVDDLPLAFIAPLGAHDHGARHPVTPPT